MFTDQQKALLENKLDKADVKTRVGANGRRVSYVEGWYVVDMANEIFGFGNWDIETPQMTREHEPVQIPPTEENPKGGIVVTYSAKVRVTVYSVDHAKKIVRERTGGHRGFGVTVGQAIEDAMKAAETDATKRAFVTFGNVFGLALYDKEQRGVGTPEQRPEQRQIPHNSQPAMAPIDEGFSGDRPKISERAMAASQQPLRNSVSRQGANGLNY